MRVVGTAIQHSGDFTTPRAHIMMLSFEAGDPLPFVTTRPPLHVPTTAVYCLYDPYARVFESVDPASSRRRKASAEIGCPAPHYPWLPRYNTALQGFSTLRLMMFDFTTVFRLGLVSRFPPPSPIWRHDRVKEVNEG